MFLSAVPVYFTEFIIQLHEPRLYGQFSSPLHGIPRIGGEVEKNLLHLSRVGHDDDIFRGKDGSLSSTSSVRSLFRSFSVPLISFLISRGVRVTGCCLLKARRLLVRPAAFSAEARIGVYIRSQGVCVLDRPS